MKDRAFSGATLDEAIALAAETLGLPPERLKYVVLEGGAPGGRGLKPTPARIAVLLADARPEPADRPREGLGGPDPLSGIRSVVRAVVEAAGVDVAVEVESGPEALLVRLAGPGKDFFLEPAGRGEVLRALEHVLQRAFSPQLEGRALHAECEGFREQRDAALAEEARRLAEAVRADGAPRTTEPLNAYERRIVHLAIGEVAGVITYSVGEGAGRRVTVAPAPEGAREAAPGAVDRDGAV